MSKFVLMAKARAESIRRINEAPQVDFDLMLAWIDWLGGRLNGEEVQAITSEVLGKEDNDMWCAEIKAMKERMEQKQ